jgi:hypothetical protein
MDPEGFCGGDEAVRDFSIEYYLIVGDKHMEKVELNVSIEDTLANNKMNDIFLKNLVLAKAKEPITIAVRYFFRDDRFVC